MAIGTSAAPARKLPARQGRRPRLEVIPAEVRNLIFERVAIGVPVVKAGQSCGIHSRTLLRWLDLGRREGAREPYRSFAEQVDFALGELAVNGIRELSEHGAKDWRAKAWILERAVPEFVEQEDRRRGGGQVNVQVVLNSEREDLAARLLAAAQQVLGDDPDRLEAFMAAVAGGEVVEGEAVEVGELGA